MKQVKVKQIETYKDSQGEHIICKGKFILIPIDQEKDPFGIGPPNYLIISETEKIEVGDYYYDNNLKFISREACSKEMLITIKELQETGKIISKILALPENFSPKHLQAIVDGKLRDGDEVLIKCEEALDCRGRDAMCFSKDCASCECNIIKLSNNHIKLFPINKEETWDEVFLAYNNHYNEIERIRWIKEFLESEYLPPKRK